MSLGRPPKPFGAGGLCKVSGGKPDTSPVASQHVARRQLATGSLADSNIPLSSPQSHWQLHWPESCLSFWDTNKCLLWYQQVFVVIPTSVCCVSMTAWLSCGLSNTAVIFSCFLSTETARLNKNAITTKPVAFPMDSSSCAASKTWYEDLSRTYDADQKNNRMQEVGYI